MVDEDGEDTLDVCDKSTKQEQPHQLKNYKRKKAGKKKKIHQCPNANCTATFKYKTSWVNHLKTHTGEKPYECYICLKRFTTNGNRKDHERRHANQTKRLSAPKIQGSTEV